MTSERHNKIRRVVYLATLIGLIVLPLSVMAYKLFVLKYPLAGLIPVESYDIDVVMQVDGHGEDIEMSTYLPKADSRQSILVESNSSPDFTLAVTSDPDNRLATWNAESAQGRHDVRYTYSVLAKHVRYVIPEDLNVPGSYPKEMEKYLAEEPGVQVNDPLIEKTLKQIIPAGNPSLYLILKSIHRHLQDNLANKNFSGFTDAITALKLGEASCNGKSRAFAAMARKSNIPARLVGGLVMKQGSKRTSHQWVELFLNGHWVPFDTINDHFAELPANYLTLYYGDLSLFKHTPNINFQYHFKTVKKLIPRQEMQESLGTSVFNIASFYSLFEKLGISQNLLKIILTIPLGAFVVVVFRNVVGIQTFGTFLPALIAAAARQTGLMWGLIGFALIVILSSLIRRFLDWMHLLHSPKMAVMLTMVVIIMLTIGAVSAQHGNFELAQVTLFPIAILAITAERFAIIEAEEGFASAMKITFTSLFVISACYAVMDSIFLQSVIVAFPELLFFVIALNLWLGKWIGMRASEFYRFRKLIFAKPS